MGDLIAAILRPSPGLSIAEIRSPKVQKPMGVQKGPKGARPPLSPSLRVEGVEWCSFPKTSSKRDDLRAVSRPGSGLTIAEIRSPKVQNPRPADQTLNTT